MKQMKKFMLAVLTAAMLTGFTACGDDKMNDATGGDKDTTQEQNNSDGTGDRDSVGDDVRDGVDDVTEGIGDGIEDVGEGVGEGVKDLGDGVTGNDRTDDGNTGTQNAPGDMK